MVMSEDRSFEKMQRHFRDMEEKESESIFLEIKLEKIREIGPHMCCEILDMDVPTRSFIFMDCCSITTCRRNV